ncbi:protein HGV2 [Prorops nasuta]|uniref:protein HGV2 n=1 Tax=Prorops nasuta TaxID=863751 RepID=UPI0034CE1BA0
MADIADSGDFTDPFIAISQGKRHLLVRDYVNAVSALSQAVALLVQKHGDIATELAEPYVLYGRALLGLAREEAGVLGEGVPGGEEAAEDCDDDDEDEDEEKLSNIDEKEEDEENEQSEKAEVTKDDETKVDETKVDEAKVEEAKVEETKKEDGDKKSDDQVKETKKTEEGEAAGQEVKGNVDSAPEPVAGSSKDGLLNGEASCSTHNGDAKENGEDEEDIGKEDDNLQVAWEVLELAKLILLKHASSGGKLLAEAYRLLGEVAMEAGNHQGALIDLSKSLDILEKMDPPNPRAIAEMHFQLGIAYSMGDEFDSSIEQFNKATDLLKIRISELEKITDPPKSDDPFYTVEGEIQELKELLPQIEDKITDMKDFKQQTYKLVMDSIKSKVASDEGCSNGAGPSTETPESSGSSTLQKPATDISHLVRKKRKAEETESEVASLCKKPTPEKSV